MKPDRLWCLKQFAAGGWTTGRGDWLGVKKWDGHKAALVKARFLEQDAECLALYRITDEGRGVLEKPE